MSNIETWSEIKDYEGYYMISNFGEIKSLTRIESYYHTKSGKMVERIRLREDGHTLSSISKRLGLGTSTIHRVVKNNV